MSPAHELRPAKLEDQLPDSSGIPAVEIASAVRTYGYASSRLGTPGGRVMSLHRLSAGAGYRYLVRHTACGDASRDPATPLTAYYTDSGYPAGRWIGTGLAGLADGAGLEPATVVSEQAMARLFARGHDPVTDDRLGKAYPTFRAPDQRAAARIGALPPSLTREQRDTLTAQIHAQEQARGTSNAVAGFDLTFTIPKSASIRWALGDTSVQAAVATAHAEAVADAIGFLEDHALFTRTGVDGVAQVHTRGAVAAAFDHWDTRTGDPNLHTHIVLANKVQGPDGEWRALDSRALYQAAVAVSEIYDDLFVDRLHAGLPTAWGWRDRGPRRSPAFEIEDVDDRLIREFSTRSVTITENVRVALNQFRRSTGRTPSRAEVLRLRQQVTRATRPVKTVRRLAEQLANWRLRAERLPVIPRRAGAYPPLAVTADALSPATVARLAANVLDGVQQRRSTWTRWNVLAETARTCRAIRFHDPVERHGLHERVTETALSACMSLSVRDAFTVPDAYRRPDSESVFTRHFEDRHTSRTILDAETRLLAAHHDLAAPFVHMQVAGDGEQAAAIRALASSGRRVDVLVGAAGTGKTRTLQQFLRVWEAEHGAGSVIGLAPSATAARELAHSLGVPCENTAKWLHESGRPNPIDRWRLRAGQVVIVDEASLAGTLALDQITTQARVAGAKVLLVGDHRQLDAVEAGGAFGLLATCGWPVELGTLWRFRHRWEARATLQLRDGDADCLDAYAAHGRLHDGPWEIALDAAYEGARAAEADGRVALLVALDTSTVEALNARARADRIADGTVTLDGVTVQDGAAIGVGDRVVTRRNNRRLGYGDGEFVRNGTLWDVTAVHPDGSIDTRRAGHDADRAEVVRLPAGYVHGHVELGYASTLHRAEGMTVDSSHLVATATVTREALYVGMTRGREENHCYLATDVALDFDGVPDQEIDPRAVMEAILARNGVELSAIQTLTAAERAAVSPERLGPVTATVLAEAATRRWISLLPSLGYPPNVVRKINTSRARGPLVAMLQNGHLAGHDMASLMFDLAHQVPDDDPAERLHDQVQQWLRSHETDNQAMTPAEARDLHIEEHRQQGESETVELLDQLRAVGRRRLAQVDATAGRPPWLPPVQTPSVAPSIGSPRPTPEPPVRSL